MRPWNTNNTSNANGRDVFEREVERKTESEKRRGTQMNQSLYNKCCRYKLAKLEKIIKPAVAETGDVSKRRVTTESKTTLEVRNPGREKTEEEFNEESKKETCRKNRKETGEEIKEEMREESRKETRGKTREKTKEETKEETRKETREETKGVTNEKEKEKEKKMKELSLEDKKLVAFLSSSRVSFDVSLDQIRSAMEQAERNLQAYRDSHVLVWENATEWQQCNFDFLCVKYCLTKGWNATFAEYFAQRNVEKTLPNEIRLISWSVSTLGSNGGDLISPPPLDYLKSVEEDDKDVKERKKLAEIEATYSEKKFAICSTREASLLSNVPIGWIYYNCDFKGLFIKTLEGWDTITHPM